MLDVKAALLALLGVFALGFLFCWIADIRRRSRAGSGSGRPSPLEIGIGAVTNFFDTLGIGSFAPTTSIFKLRRLVPDEVIPGTLNVGHCVPVIAQAFLFIAIVEVETRTLIAMIAAAVLGAWLGAGIVAGWPLFIALSIGAGILWGLWRGEWDQAPARSRRPRNWGLAALFVAVLMIAFSSLA